MQSRWARGLALRLGLSGTGLALPRLAQLVMRLDNHSEKYPDLFQKVRADGHGMRGISQPPYPMSCCGFEWVFRSSQVVSSGRPTSFSARLERLCAHAKLSLLALSCYTQVIDLITSEIMPLIHECGLAGRAEYATEYRMFLEHPRAAQSEQAARCIAWRPRAWEALAVCTYEEDTSVARRHTVLVVPHPQCSSTC